MKKLLIIGSTLVAFSAVNLFANNNSNAHTLSSYNVSDTVPKKDTTKKDSLFQLDQSAAFVASLDTVPKKDTSKKDTTFLAMR